MITIIQLGKKRNSFHVEVKIMDGTHLTYWLWVYRIAAIGMFGICIILVLIIGSVLGNWKKKLIRIVKSVRKIHQLKKEIMNV